MNALFVMTILISSSQTFGVEENLLSAKEQQQAFNNIIQTSTKSGGHNYWNNNNKRSAVNNIQSNYEIKLKSARTQDEVSAANKEYIEELKTSKISKVMTQEEQRRNEILNIYARKKSFDIANNIANKEKYKVFKQQEQYFLRRNAPADATNEQRAEFLAVQQNYLLKAKQSPKVIAGKYVLLHQSQSELDVLEQKYNKQRQENLSPTPYNGYYQAYNMNYNQPPGFGYGQNLNYWNTGNGNIYTPSDFVCVPTNSLLTACEANGHIYVRQDFVNTGERSDINKDTSPTSHNSDSTISSGTSPEN
jgi:hypothetical protein